MRIMPTLIAAILGALAVWGIAFAIWICFEHTAVMAALLFTAGGALAGALTYRDLVEIDELYEGFSKTDE